MKAACFTVAAMDYFPQAGVHCPGGNAYNQSLAFRRTGHQSSFIGALGTDDAGDRMAALLCNTGVDVARLRRVAGCTASNRILNDASGERFGVEGAWNGGVYDQFSLDEDDWGHIRGHEVWATHLYCPSLDEAVRRKAPGQLLAVDFLHLPGFEFIRLNRDRLDIAYVGGVGQMAGPLSALARETGILIVLTLGAGGSIAFQGGRQWRQPALAVERVVDTTGCGDAFQAAFTAAYFARRNIPAALLAGAEAGRAACSHLGAVGPEYPG